MIEILTWNIQAGKGADGRIDLPRIADVIRSMGDADVICLQEVSRFINELDGGTDQVRQLAQLFPAHSSWFGAGVDMIAEDSSTEYRRSFGNMILSRLPVMSVFRHALPQPAAAGVKHMARQAMEVTVSTPAGPLRIITTHLEFNAPGQRSAQVARLRDVHFEAARNAQDPSVEARGPYAPLQRPEALVLCGDFNFEPASDDYAAVLASFDDGVAPLVDAWRCVHGDAPHDPTCGIHDHEQWPDGAHCRDFFFITPDVCTRTTAVRVDTQTDASDHQPLLLSLRD